MQIFHHPEHGYLGALNKFESPIVSDSFVVPDRSLESDCIPATAEAADSLEYMWELRERSLRGLTTGYEQASSEQQQAIEAHTLRLAEESRDIQEIVRTIRGHIRYLHSQPPGSNP